jgi:hypothetical protein
MINNKGLAVRWILAVWILLFSFATSQAAEISSFTMKGTGKPGILIHGKLETDDVEKFAKIADTIHNQTGADYKEIVVWLSSGWRAGCNMDWRNDSPIPNANVRVRAHKVRQYLRSNLVGWQ